MLNHVGFFPDLVFFCSIFNYVSDFMKPLLTIQAKKSNDFTLLGLYNVCIYLYTSVFSVKKSLHILICSLCCVYYKDLFICRQVKCHYQNMFTIQEVPAGIGVFHTHDTLYTLHHEIKFIML